MDRKSLSQGLAATSVGFGALAILAPGTMLKVYGAPTSPTARAMTRLWGTRNALLGFPLLAPTIDGSPPRSALQASATSALFGALAGCASSLD